MSSGPPLVVMMSDSENQNSPVTSGVRADDRDSDHVDTDVEAELYSQIHHQDNRERDELVHHLTHVNIVPEKGTPLPAKIDIITISSDSESDEPSKSEMVSQKVGQKRKRNSPSPSTSIDESGDDIEFLPDFQFDAFHRRNAAKLAMRPTVSNNLRKFGNGKQKKNRYDKRTSLMSDALKGFTLKCRPNFVAGGLLQTVKTPQKVNIDLLNMTPGNSNRFKRIKLDEGEDPALWRIDNADINTRKSRYYANGRKEVVCLNCKKFTDHVISDCPYPRAPTVCYVCAEIGHTGHSCHKVICGKCFKTGHVSTACPMQMDRVACTECDYTGHSFNDCPNHWRKYSKTTTPPDDDRRLVAGDLVRSRRSACCVCASNNHCGFECPKRESDMVPRCSPFLDRTSSFDLERGHSSNSRNRQRSCTITSSQVSCSFPSASSPIRSRERSAIANILPKPFEGLRSEPGSSRRTTNATVTATSSHHNDYRPTIGELQEMYPVSLAPKKKVSKKQKKKMMQAVARKGKKAKANKNKIQAQQSQNRDNGNNGRWKENKFTCSDGKSRTWKEIWTAPSSSPLLPAAPSSTPRPCMSLMG